MEKTDKKKAKPDLKTEAKRNMLGELKKMATGMMGQDIKGKMDGMKKVTVAAKDDASLKKGLDTAKEILGSHTDEDPDHTDEKAHDEIHSVNSTNADSLQEDNMDDVEEDPEESPAESHDEIQAKITELQNKLKSIKK